MLLDSKHDLYREVRRKPAGLVEELEAAVQHHVQEEETKAFPAMRERLADELDSLGTAVEQRKRDLT
jgi:hypothetical protein